MSLPYDYYPAVLFAINVLGQGNTLSEACLQANIEVSTFRRYIEKDAQLKAMYEDAEQLSYDAMADALINIDNHRIHGQSDSRMAKVISENIKWVLSKRRPKEYGERIEIKHELTMDRAITDALNAARHRTKLPPMQTILDAEIVDDDEEETLNALLR